MEAPRRWHNIAGEYIYTDSNDARLLTLTDTIRRAERASEQSEEYC